MHRLTGTKRLFAARLFLCFIGWLGLFIAGRAGATDSFARTVAGLQPKLVKIYGAGGFRGLEPYQSGILISPDGHVLTAWSYVLDTDTVTVVLDDGARFTAELLGPDPLLEVAVLKIAAENLSYFDLAEAVEAPLGAPVLAVSNLFGIATGDEPLSVLHGYVSARTRLEARRGVFETPYRGEVYIVDAVTNNPGAAGGALTTADGQLLAMLGKELRNQGTNTWLNYAIPIAQLRQTVEEIRTGQFVRRPEQTDVPRPDNPHTLAALGIRLVPDVVERTPPYVDAVRYGSPAEAVGIQADDLILFVGRRLVQSYRDVLSELETIPQTSPLPLTLLRKQDLIEVEVQVPDGG